MPLLSERLTDRQLISRGDLTLAFRARDSVLDRRVFVKCLNPALAADPEIRARFQREARAVARLDHANLVRIYEYGEDPAEGLFMLLEWLEGRTLSAQIAEGERTGGEEFVDLAEQLLNGLSALHGVGILHRDLKPDNILVGEIPGGSGDPPRRPGEIPGEGGGAARRSYKITDFSLAALRDAPRLTHHEAIVGTPAYMSPEQAAGGSPDERGDLFSLGVVLYEAATGENPFASTSMLDTLRAIREKEVNLEHPAILALPGKARDLLKRLLEKDAANRPAHARAALALLSADEEAAPVTEKTRPRSAKRDLAYGAAALGVLAVWVGMILWYPWPHDPGEPTGGFKKFVLPGILLIAFWLVLMLRMKLWRLPGQKGSTGRGRMFTWLAMVAIVLVMVVWKPWLNTTNLPLNTPAKPDTGQTGRPMQSMLHAPQEVKIPPKLDESTKVSEPRTSEPEFRAADEPAFREPESPTPASRHMTVDDFAAMIAADTTLHRTSPGKDSVDLWLTTEPWSNVFLNGAQLGTTPLMSALRLPKGDQTLVLRNPAFPPIQLSLNLTGQSMRKEVRLTDYTALVHFNVEPWGELYLDGEHVGTSPLSNPLYASPGRHSLRITHPQFSPVQQDFTSDAGTTVIITANMPKGELTVKENRK